MPFRKGRFTKWKHTVEIKQFLNIDPDADVTQEILERTATDIAAQFRAKGFPEHKDERLDDILWWLKDSATEGEEEFNHRLDELYDWADEELVWLGI